MIDTRELKCKCCHCWDSYEGCRGFDCAIDYKLSISRVKEVSKEHGISVDAITTILLAEEAKRMSDAIDTSDIIPDDFDPVTDTQFLISCVSAIDLDKKRLVDLDTEDLKRLRAELDFVLEMR